MGNDSLSAQDAIMRGQARAEAAFRKFLQGWTEPMMKMNLKALWVMMPPEQKEALKQANRKQYEKVSEFFEAMD